MNERDKVSAFVVPAAWWGRTDDNKIEESHTPRVLLNKVCRGNVRMLASLFQKTSSVESGVVCMSAMAPGLPYLCLNISIIKKLGGNTVC